MAKEKRSIGDLSSIIGGVSKGNANELKKAAQEFEIKKPVEQPKPQSPKVVEEVKPQVAKQVKEVKVKSAKPAQPRDFSIGGLEFAAKVKKIPESFRIKPSLKAMVEEIVAKAKASGNDVSKGDVYNLLIAKGLKDLG